MIEVIKPGFLREAECLHCGSILRFNILEDVKLSNEAPLKINKNDNFIINQGPLFIHCPICKQKIVVSKEVYSNEI